jgi:hypothetical protein
LKTIFMSTSSIVRVADMVRVRVSPAAQLATRVSSLTGVQKIAAAAALRNETLISI